MKMLLLVAAGGACGATGRYLVGGLAKSVFGLGFPWGTLIVNILGSFLMGVLIEIFALRQQHTPIEVQAFLTIGVLGGFTTFSAFSLDVVVLLERKQHLAAATYLGSSVLLSILALFAGLIAVRTVMQ